MTQTLSSLGTISYNGFPIGGPRVQTKLSVRPQYDSSGRTNIYNVFKFVVTFILTSDAAGLGGGSDTGTNVFTILALLNQPGGQLLINGLGYGSFNLNVATGQSDVLYGPKPEVTNVQPLGANLAMSVTWSCEFAIANCTSSLGLKGILGQLTELVYTSDWTIDAQGLTTVMTHGHSTIALNRSGIQAKSISYTADQNRESLAPNAPLGMRLESQKWTLSEDKSREDFTFTFKELASDNPLPAGVFDIQMRHRTRVQRDGVKGGFAIAISTVSGYVDTVKPNTPAYGFDKAVLIINERLNAAVAGGHRVFITDLDVDEPVFGARKINFSMSYYITGTNLKTFLIDSGMFLPSTVGDWGSWRDSMLAGAWGPRGTYGLSFDPGSDVIVDHCNQSFPPSSSQDNVSPGSYYQPGSFTNSTSQTDYHLFDSKFGVDTGANSVNHYPLDQSPPANSGGTGNAPNNYGTPQGQFTPPMDNTQPAPVTQIMGQKPVRVVLYGSGVRQNAPVEIPTVANTFGKTTGYNSLESSIDHTAFTNYFGATLYAATWYIVYDMALTPDQIGQVLQGDLSTLVVGTDNDPTNKT
jgi:hypothetical protein